MEAQTSQAAEVLGTRCFVGDLEQASMRVLERVETGNGGYVCQANAHVLVTACNNEAVRRALDAAWVIHPDGWPVSWLARRLGASRATRIAGAELMSRLFELGAPVGLRHYLFGSTPEVIKVLRDTLSVRHPDALIVGALSPSFGQQVGERALRDVETIRSAKPDIIWCALGAPKQELWMSRYALLVSPAVVIGVGAAFDFHAGTKRRAPEWMQRNGLEWAHRFWSEPRRLARRYVQTNSEFILRAAVQIAYARRSTT